MKTLVLSTLTLGFLLTPVIMLQTMVMPQLNELKNIYGGMDTTVQHVVDGATATGGDIARQTY